PNVEFNMPTNLAASTMVEGYCSQSHLGCGFVLLNPGAGWESRRWSVRKFGAVSRYLGQQYQVPTVVAWAGAEEEEMATTIVQKSGGHALKAPRTTLVELCELIRKSRFYLGCDTGPMHMAAAVGTPCITLHGPTLATHSGAYGGQNIAVQAFYQESDRKSSSAAMNAIEVDHVNRACDEMLTRQGQKKINEAA
ncbi:MAG: glycosyltransferase family 9 protein, partial [Planctomycetota bacterium]